MTATDELRRLLDERGVEWLEGSPNKTKWHVGGIEFVATNAWPRNDATRTKMVVHAMYPTPEQAVEATLGRGTCEMEYVPDWMGWHCKSCDNLRQGLRDQKPRYCPNCGRKVRA